MAGAVDGDSFSFSDFPEDVQLCILSFLSPAELAIFACTSKRFVYLCRDDGKLWHATCDRRWGEKTQIRKWGNGRIAYRLLYKTLNNWENLIGFWRRCGQANSPVASPRLVFFEWGPSFVSGSRVFPSKDGTYCVTKTPFLWMGISSDGRIANFLDLDGDTVSASDFEELGISDGNFVPVNVNFMGNGHFLVEENQGFTYHSLLEDKMKGVSISKTSSSGEESEEDISGISPKDCLVTEMYTRYANRTSPGGDRRRQRRKVKERQRRTKWEPEHFVKMVDCSPTLTRPLQGLWKGFCNGTNLEFYFIKYDEVGGIICRKVGDLSLSQDSAPVFWTSNPTFVESPLSPEEERIFDGRLHIGPLMAEDHVMVVSRMMCINSSQDLVLHSLVGNGSDPWGEGRIWVYKNGSFGFGFLRDQFIIDLKRVVEDGFLLDAWDASKDCSI